MSSSHLPNKFNITDLPYLEGPQCSASTSLMKSSVSQGANSISLLVDNNNSPKNNHHDRSSLNLNHQPSQTLENLQVHGSPTQKDQLHTPISTPTTARKSRRRSNLFIPSSKKEDKLKNSELGSGRSIPLKQGNRIHMLIKFEICKSSFFFLLKDTFIKEAAKL